MRIPWPPPSRTHRRRQTATERFLLRAEAAKRAGLAIRAITRPEFEVVYGLEYDTIRRIPKTELSYVKRGRLVLYFIDDIEAWLRSWRVVE